MGLQLLPSSPGHSLFPDPACLLYEETEDQEAWGTQNVQTEPELLSRAPRPPQPLKHTVFPTNQPLPRSPGPGLRVSLELLLQKERVLVSPQPCLRESLPLPGGQMGGTSEMLGAPFPSPFSPGPPLGSPRG